MNLKLRLDASKQNEIYRRDDYMQFELLKSVVRCLGVLQGQIQIHGTHQIKVYLFTQREFVQHKALDPNNCLYIIYLQLIHCSKSHHHKFILVLASKTLRCTFTRSIYFLPADCFDQGSASSFKWCPYNVESIFIEVQKIYIY